MLWSRARSTVARGAPLWLTRPQNTYPRVRAQLAVYWHLSRVARSHALSHHISAGLPLFLSVCFDCPANSPDWASVSHGTLVCLHCAGRHRTLGVHVSRIKSLTMDAWEPPHVAAMLLSGNAQVKGFFKRQKVPSSPIEGLYPRVRAAEFYRAELAKQVLH